MMNSIIKMKVYQNSSKFSNAHRKMYRSIELSKIRRIATMEISIVLLFGLLISVNALDNSLIRPPTFDIQPSTSSTIAHLKGTKILHCKASGRPKPQYQWLKNGKALTEFRDEEIYKISNAKKNDSGFYQCLARNEAGTIFSEKSEVVIAYMGKFKSNKHRTINVESGHAVILDLEEIESVPKPTVSWELLDGSTNNDVKYYKTSKNQLIVFSVDHTDDGKGFRALAINAQLGTNELSPITYLSVSGDPNVDVEPEIVIPLEDKTAVKGKESVFECVANARPLYLMDTLWFKDKIPIENANIIFDLGWRNRTLILRSVDVDYAGEYSCKVQMKTGDFKSKVSKAMLSVIEPPQFNDPMQSEIITDYGSKIEIPCDVTGIPTPMVKWYRNSEEIDVFNSNEYRVRDDNTLVIQKINLIDSAMWQCLAMNDAGEKSLYVWIKVKTVVDESFIVNSINAGARRVKRLAQPRIIGWDSANLNGFVDDSYKKDSSSPIMEIYPQNITTLDGKDVTFQCKAIGAPSPDAQWMYNDTIIVQSTNRLQIHENGNLFISNVQESDTGSYKCIRSNEAGSVTGEAFLGVLVRTQITQPPVDTTVLLGLTATLQCKVSSDRNVNYTINWFRDRQSSPVTTNSRFSMKDDGTLEITAVRASDVGLYTCLVDSAAGNESRSAKLNIVELPFAPTNVQAQRLSEPDLRTVNISWTPGFDGNSPILKYIIQRREVLELENTGPLPDNLQNWITELSNVSASDSSALIFNLKAATNYQFRVSAINRVGEGYPSEPSNTLQLPQEVPSSPPSSIVGSARSSSEVIAQWQPVPEEHRNGLILGYILRYKLNGYRDSPWTYQNVTNEAQRSYLIQDLITWKDYIIQIAAYNNMGVGVYSEGIRVKTKESVPEDPPSNIRIEVVNSTAVFVSWKPPSPQHINGINQGYKIQAWQQENVDGSLKDVIFKIVKVAPNLINPLEEQNCTMNGLVPYTYYNITILCFTNPGDGVHSSPILIRTEEDVPGEVSNMQFDGVSDRELTLKWNEPKEQNGIIKGYQVKYKIKDSAGMKQVNLTAHDKSLHVTQLKAMTHYWFEVKAWTSKGSGVPRTAVIQSGIEPVNPEPPNTLALSNIEAFSVVIQFNPGFDGNSSIIKWIVEAQTARNDLWIPIDEISDPDATTITVKGLSPYTLYKLRIIAVNVAGRSKASEPTKDFQTIQAIPKHAPYNVTVRAMSATELRVRWIPLQQTEWFGNPKGYNVTYQLIEKDMEAKATSVSIEDPTSNSYVLKNLEEFSLYEIVVAACNEVGQSAESNVALERTRESVPSSGPLNVQANATSSTTIVVQWSEIPKSAQNGQIEGYKVFYGAPGHTSIPVMQKTIPNNKTFTATLTELKKFVEYHIQILAYTRLGDGTLSFPPVRAQTYEDTPGKPSNVSFPDVTYTTARIIWDTPEESNGEILAYKVTYQMNESNKLEFSREFSPLDRTFRATNLLSEHYYTFTVTAQTRVGWGVTASALVYTTNNRELPQSPSMPQISRSQIQANQITFSWTPGRDGFAPLRYYTVQLKENEAIWTTLSERIDPFSSSYTATNLKPYTLYQFRIRAINDIGPSSYSKESIDVRTLPAAPAEAVSGVVLTPITTNSVRVEWIPLDRSMWNGDSDGGYKIVYQPIDFIGSKVLNDIPKLDVIGIDKNVTVLKDLTQDLNYEIIIYPYNKQGLGPGSSPLTVYVGEAVPTGEPLNFEAVAVSSTEVRLKWKAPNLIEQNGDLLGYKIFYTVISSPQPVEDGFKYEEEIEVVPASYNSHSLVFLDKFTEYKIQILAFNPAGDGPRSNTINVKTLQGLPGPPTNLTFSDITMNSLIVSWNPPQYRNGEIIGYIVTYETTEDNDKYSKQVKQKVTDTHLLVQNLEEEVTYTFTVRAQTIDYGLPIVGNITTGPQDGSPLSPTDLLLSKSVAYINLRWVNGPSGRGPIKGYYIESQKRDDTKWSVVAKSSNGQTQDFTVSFQTLLPSTVYKFRVSSYNRYGISCPTYSDEPVLTPSKLYLEYGYLQQTPFYRQQWFSMSLACVGTIIIIMVIAVLCVKSKSEHYKQEAQKTLEESIAMSVDERQELAIELYRSRHGLTNSAVTNPIGTIGRSKGGAITKKGTQSSSATLGKSPPRPSPASVAYHSDEESLKCYDEEDSSVTEKPSEISSSESQHSESENESIHSDVHSFVNHYANINNTLRQSWKRQHVKTQYSSYTDSEPEGSTVMSLNGGQIIMNNMARSRAPLPGFSSFV